MNNKQEEQAIASHIEEMKRIPLVFFRTMWGLEPQQPKPEFAHLLKEAHASKWKAEWFGTKGPGGKWEWHDFTKGLNLTWQQTSLLVYLQRAMRGDPGYSMYAAVKAGRGVGKSFIVAGIILWFLFTRRESIVPCTAPTQDQLHDVLWKELNAAIDKMPEAVQEQFDVTADYVRVGGEKDGKKWFARARTGKKDNPEALAGLHADDMLVVADEASGVDKQVFITAEGSLTNDDPFMLLISNPTRLEGYFFERFKSPSWGNFTFNSEESPMVSEKFLNNMLEACKGNRDHPTYMVHVRGEFPLTATVDEEGYMMMITPSDIAEATDYDTSHNYFYQPLMLGVDPAGEGDDEAVWVIRDEFRARIVERKSSTTEDEILQITKDIARKYGVNPRNIMVDAFGIGADIMNRFNRAGFKAEFINVANQKTTNDAFQNQKAEFYWKMKTWLRMGGKLIANDSWDELERIYYRKGSGGKLSVMGKKEMRKKKHVESPNCADALALTFARKPRGTAKHYGSVNPLKPISKELGC